MHAGDIKQMINYIQPDYMIKNYSALYMRLVSLKKKGSSGEKSPSKDMEKKF